MASFHILLVAACAVICTAQPVQKAAGVMIKQNAEVLFNAGPAILDCVLEGDVKDVKYAWFKNGQPFTPSGDVIQRKDEGTLEFKNPKPSDEGKYQCFAQSELGTASTRVISFKRQYIVAPKVVPQTHKPIEGRPYKLDCSAPDAYPQPIIAWKTQEGSKIEVHLDRRSTSSPDGPLWFSNVTKEDVNPNRKYICVATSPFYGDVVLAEHVMAELVQDSQPKNGELVSQYLSNEIMVTKAGNVTMIWCIYGGTPLAHPDWFKNGKDVNGKPSDRITRYNRTSGRRLLFKDTFLEDAGVYKCVANNEVGKPQEHTINLIVVSEPSFDKIPEQSITAQKGSEVKIPCQVKGVPAPKVTYTLNGKALATSDRVTVSSEGITIKNVLEQDKGYYGCRAQNDHGDEYVESLVIVN